MCSFFYYLGCRKQLGDTYLGVFLYSSNEILMSSTNYSPCVCVSTLANLVKKRQSGLMGLNSHILSPVVRRMPGTCYIVSANKLGLKQ